MPIILAATRIPVPGNKLIEEFVGHATTGTNGYSIAHMIAPPGWSEPPQRPSFDEVTIVLRGTMRIETADGTVDIGAGQVVLCRSNERVCYSNPGTEESEYWAVCVPAFHVDTAGREG